jgi:hypothetical protein
MTTSTLVLDGKDPRLLFRGLGYVPDPWQSKILTTQAKRILLNCARQSGKSTVVAALATHELVFKPGSMIVVLSHTEDQAVELFRKVLEFYDAMDRPCFHSKNRTELVLSMNGLKSRLICLPCKEDSIRCYSRVSLLIIDEAARVPDDVYRAARPMLAAVKDGRIICLSTPAGKRGFFYEAWTGTQGEWYRCEVKGDEVSRLSPEFLDEEELVLGPTWFAQEYCCSFEVVQGAVYPDFASTLTTWEPVCHVPRHLLRSTDPRAHLTRVGGLDFGWSDPFVALWGFYDREGVLWIEGEIYASHEPISIVEATLPRGVIWHADPSNPLAIAELKRRDHKIRRPDPSRTPGIGMVAARIRRDTLRIHKDKCPNLIRESALYRHTEGEQTEGEDHALDALRYLVVGIDPLTMHRLKKLA